MQRSTTYDNFVEIDESGNSFEQMIRFQRVEGGRYETITLKKALEEVAAEPDDIIVPFKKSSQFYYNSSSLASNISEPSMEFHLSGISILTIIYVICYII